MPLGSFTSEDRAGRALEKKKRRWPWLYGVSPNITGRDIGRVGMGDLGDEGWRARYRTGLNAYRDQGYPIARPGLLSRYRPEEGTAGGMRLPGNISVPTTRGGYIGNWPGEGGATMGSKGYPGRMALSGPASSERETDIRRGDVPQGQPLSRGAPGGVTFGGGGGGRGTYRGAGPDPYAQGDYGRELELLSTMPEEILRQFTAIGSRGIYGPEGMETIRGLGIDPAKERLEAMPGDIMGLVRAAESQGRTAAATAMGRRFGGRMAGQPGRAAEALMGDVIAPSLGREATMAAGLEEEKVRGLNRLDQLSADLERENMLSKATIGLPGMERTIKTIAGMVSGLYKNTSLEKYLGWSPERRGAVQNYLNKMATHYGIEADRMQVYFELWLEDQFKRRGLKGYDDDWSDYMPDVNVRFG